MHRITISHSQNKQTLNATTSNISTLKNQPTYSSQKITRVLLGAFQLSRRGRNLRQKPPNPLQQYLFIELQTYSLMEKEYTLCQKSLHHQVNSLSFIPRKNSIEAIFNKTLERDWHKYPTTKCIFLVTLMLIEKSKAKHALASLSSVSCHFF